MGGVGNGVTEEDPGQDLNSSAEQTCSLGHMDQKGEEESPLACHEEEPRGSGLRAGECGSTADGSGDCRSSPTKHRLMGDA